MKRAALATALVLVGLLSACSANSGATDQPTPVITGSAPTAPSIASAPPSSTSEGDSTDATPPSGAPDTESSSPSEPILFASPQDVIKKIQCVTPDSDAGVPADAASNFDDLFQAIGHDLVTDSSACYIDDGAFKANPVMVVQVAPGHTRGEFISAVTGTQLSYWPLIVPDGGSCVIITQTDDIHAAILERLNGS